MDGLAILKPDLRDPAADLRPYIRRTHRPEPSREIVPETQLLRRDGLHGHRHGRRRATLGARGRFTRPAEMPAAGDDDGCACDNCRQEREPALFFLERRLRAVAVALVDGGIGSCRTILGFHEKRRLANSARLVYCSVVPNLSTMDKVSTADILFF